MKQSRIAAFAATALLAGCGGTSYDTADEAMVAVQEVLPECTDVVANPDEMMVQEAQSCDYTASDGTDDTIQVSTFASSEQQDNWQAVADGLADEGWGSQGFLVAGDGWVIGLRNRTNAEALAEELGGDLR